MCNTCAAFFLAERVEDVANASASPDRAVASRGNATLPGLMKGASAEIGLCLLFSAADGEISEAELFALTTRVGHLLGDDFPIGRLQGLVETELSTIGEMGADAYVASLAQRIEPDRRFEAVRAACKVACADGLSPEEEEMVHAACEALDVDVQEIVTAVGWRKTLAAAAESHDDAPNDATRLIEQRLLAAGWTDPMKHLRAAGVGIGGFGAVALQYQSANGHLLRLEHHTCDGTIHFHVTDESDIGADFVLQAEGCEETIVDAVVAMQDDVTLANVESKGLAKWISPAS
ncbi:MAG TPA: tellurite resistance TerB family protein [Labilithrix sp.]